MSLSASTVKRSSGHRQRKMGRSEEGVNPSAATKRAGVAEDEVDGVQGEGEFERMDKVNQLHRNPKGRISLLMRRGTSLEVCYQFCKIRYVATNRSIGRIGKELLLISIVLAFLQKIEVLDHLKLNGGKLNMIFQSSLVL